MRALSDSLSRDYSILFTCPFLRRNQVSAVVRKEFGSKACDRKDLLDIIDEEWNAMRKEKPFLFNQSKFRYFSGTMTDQPSPHCHLNLGLTDYKSYIGSNMGRRWEVFYREGEKIGDPNAFFGNPFGNQCTVVLNDGYHILLNRSYQVTENEGLLCCVGGHSEPSVLHIQSYEDAAATPSDAIVGELFDSMQREVHEETNIPYDLVSKMSMTGVLQSNVSHGRQVHLFCCFVDLNRQQVLEYYRKGPEDQYESLGIKFLTLDAIVEGINAHPELYVPEMRGAYAALLAIEPHFQSYLVNP